MLEVDGLALIKKFKANEWFWFILVFVVSVKSDFVVKIKVLNIGVDDYV